jgi:hypothetical protein
MGNQRVYGKNMASGIGLFLGQNRGRRENFTEWVLKIDGKILFSAMGIP